MSEEARIDARLVSAWITAALLLGIGINIILLARIALS